tara:strand:- start:74 stop:724 length:651 start_codon:yes stop_codon:yes gene_type:complete
MQIENRIVGEGTEAPDQLLAHPQNWRKHPPEQQNALLDALKEIGWIKRVTVNRLTGHVVDGHLRVMLALREELPEIPVDYVELSEEEENLALATIDPIAELAKTDQAKLNAVLEAASVKNEESTALLDLIDKMRGQATDDALRLYTGTEEDDEDEDFGAAADYAESQVRMVQLFFDGTSHPDFVSYTTDLAARYGTNNITDTVFAAVKESYEAHSG